MNLLLAFISLSFESLTTLYAALFFVLILSGIGLPIPEEVTLLFGGYLAYLGVTDFVTTLYVLIAGIVIADSIGYCVGRFASRWVWRKIFHRWRFANTLLERAEQYFTRHGEKVVLFSRPFLGIRVAVPILAGHFRMNFFKFFFLDTVASVVWTILLVSLSYYLGSGFDLITEVRVIKHIVYVLIGLAIISYAGLRLMQGEKTRV